MLSKPHRLSKTRDVENVFARGRYFSSPLFRLKFLKSSNKPRFTVVVSTKVSKKAVKRNRLKRLVREFVRLRLENFSGGDYVLMVQPKAAGVDEKEFLPGLENFLKLHRLL